MVETPPGSLRSFSSAISEDWVSFCRFFDSFSEGRDVGEVCGSLVAGFGTCSPLDFSVGVSTQKILFGIEIGTSEVLSPRFCGRAAGKYLSFGFGFGDAVESLALT